jgi:hypothetical protein
MIYLSKIFNTTTQLNHVDIPKKYKKNKNRLLKALFCANYQNNYPH